MTPQPEPRRTALRLVGGTELAAELARAYDSLYEPVATYLFRRLGDRHGTEDLLHDVFVAALRALPRFEDRGVPFRHWVFRVANRAASRWLRRRQREARALARRAASGEPVDDGTAANGTDAAAAVRAALTTLPRALQDTVSLHYLAGLPVADVAAVLRVPDGTVKSRLARARELLRGALGGAP